MAEITFRNVSKSFGSTEALKNISLTCADGDLVVLFGPPGSGKSTVLRLAAGLMDPDEGEILFDGLSQISVATHSRDVAMAFEAYALYPHFTVRKNMEFPLRAPGRHLSAGTIRERVQEAAQLLEISHLLDRLPHQLSGGQRQRTSLGRALVRKSNVTLLDEPLAHLDAQLRSTLRSDLRFFLKKHGHTVLYVTPDFQEGFGIANRVVVLIGGVVHQIGTPDEVFARPADVAVAALVGDPAMTLFTSDTAKALGAASGSSQVPWANRNLPPVGHIGFRPNAVRVGASAADAPVNGTIALVERVGASVLVDVDLGSSIVKARLDEGVSARVGDLTGVVFDWSHAHMFARDGRRIDDVVIAGAA